MFASASKQALAARPQWQTGPNDLYFVLLPPGSSLLTDDGICINPNSCPSGFTAAGGYHNSYDSPTRSNTVYYAVIGDFAVNQGVGTVAHEQIEAITDPNVGNLFGLSFGWFAACGGEIADICFQNGATSSVALKGGTFSLPSLWSNKDNKCVTLSLTSCPFGDLLYCGGDGIPGDPNTLYRCSGGNLSVAQVCANGCTPKPFGVNDQCAASAAACPQGNGLYCGGNGIPGDPNTLYQCTNGNISVSQVCSPYGCTHEPAGTPDQCGGPTVCPQGNGLYCGGNGVPGNANTLYQCTNGTLSVAQVCSTAGCTPEPPGVADQCAPSPALTCPNGAGLYCGGNGIGGNPNTLYECQNGQIHVVQACSNGCTREPAGTPDQCAGPAVCPQGNGLYCGGNGVPGNANTLYQCTNGTLSVAQVCSNGCTPEPAGVSDQCAPNAALTCPNGAGLYCGGHGVGGNANTLYECQNGQLHVVQACSNGCTQMPAGVPDECTAPAGGCPNGNGLYCGGNGVSGDPNSLYQCTNGNLSVVQACSNGCQREPAGVADRCFAPSTCPDGNGLYCGGNGVTGDPNTLYQCTNGNLTVAQACSNGCTREPAGTPDQCTAPAGSCLAGNGLYCGGHGVPGNSYTLYQCTNGSLSVAQICATGCAQEPAGVPDQCASASCLAGNGLYCGGDGVPGDSNTLYQCTNGVLTVQEICAAGCAPQPAGVPDKCASQVCPNGNGLYCGGNGVTGNSNTLYQCTNGALTVSQICSNACLAMPVGVPDICM
jgi:hypothetical protein